jgi:hypothetical protein
MSASLCPNDDDLRAFALGDLPEPALERLAAHVDRCADCERLLQQFDAHSDGLVTTLKRYATAGSAVESAAVPAQLVELAKGAGDGRQVTLDPGRRLARKLAEGPCRLGRFELQAELGMGSFGCVFRAHDTELDRTVALKVQRAGSFASEEEAERFVREARSVAQLKHPGIVAIYETGRTDEGVGYLVTEFIEGETLERRLERGHVPHRAAAELAAEIADALEYAHQHGVVHRDVKPSNVLLDLGGRPHIMDFGLAKRDVGETMTSDGRVMGTPAYMSPEQARGQSHDVDARSDIYSLGVMLYELLTGERPFQGNRRLLLLQVLEDEPRSPRQLDEKLPRDLATICLKALAKTPGGRYQTAADMAEDLRRFLRGEPIKARPAGYARRLINWCRRYPLAAGVASLLVAVTLGSLAGFWYLTRLSTYFVEETALASTRMEADMLEKINTYYSEEVVGRLDWAKIKVTHQYETTPQSLPLPFTFMIDAGERITDGQSGMQVRIYSNHPWRKDGGAKDTFETRALLKLARATRDSDGDSTGDRSTDAGAADNRSYYEFTRRGTQPVLRYARAQVMKESCVKCHNGHEQSPKKDWREGDLAGVLSITRPLDQDVKRTQIGLRGAFAIMGTVAVLLVGVSLALLVGTRVSRGR